MTVRDERRDAVVEHLTDYVLAEGLGAATLRPLAAAAGTSDRMLLYYFKDKDELLSAILNRVAERMLVALDDAIPEGNIRPFHDLLQEVWQVLASENLNLFMPLWLDLAAKAARGLRPHIEISGQIADGFLAWVTRHLKVSSSRDLNADAALFMVTIEGMYLLQAVGRPGLSITAARQLKRHLKRAE